MAEMERLLTSQLPTELRALVQFLESDDRPTVVIDQEGKPLYHNKPFDGLHLSANALEALLQELEGQPHDRAQKRTAYSDGKLWRYGQILGGWKTLVCCGQSSSGDGLEIAVPTGGGELSSTMRSAGVKPGLNYSATQEQVQQSELSVGGVSDWTRFEVSGLSPWTEWVRCFDWASTGVGPMSSWGSQLRQFVVYIMNNPNPRLLLWGADQTFIYNEACIPLFGKKHPACFGKKAYEAWAEIMQELGPIIDAAYHGKSTTLRRMPLILDRGDSIEQSYWDFSLLPIMGPDGRGLAVLDEFAEVTHLVRGERRRNSVLKIAEQIAPSSTLEQLWASFVGGLETAGEDVPFAMLYSVVDDVPDHTTEDPESSADCAVHKKCALEGAIGINQEATAVAATFSLMEHYQTGPGIIKPCLEAWRTKKPVFLSSKDGSLPLSFAKDHPPFDEGVQTAIVVPILSAVGHDVLGILITGLNPRCPFDSDYKLWINLLSDILSKTASLISLPEEQRRMQKISEYINEALAQQLRMTTIEAERSDARFARMASTSPTGMYMFDADGRTLYVNDAYLALLDETREHHATRRPDAASWADQIHPDDLPIFLNSWKTIIDEKIPLTFEYRLRKPWRTVDKATGQESTGETWLLGNAFPEIGSDGNVITVQGWLTDISHRKVSENLLAQRLEDALENKRQTNNFIDMTSHEMRNPLSAILQSADSIISALTSTGMPMLGEDMTLSPSTADDIVDAAETIVLCAQHQKRIVDDILTVSKLDANLLMISPDKVQPPLLIAKALKMYESEIARAGITADTCIEPTYTDLGVDWVVLDSGRLLQVIINLLTNAIKFTQFSETRKITVCLGASRQRPTGQHHKVEFIPMRQTRSTNTAFADWGEGEDVYLQIAVIDTGQGLSEDELSVLFQRFSQASPRTHKQYGGSGLGLFISRELCELQGGQIGVSSIPGRTTFTFFVRAKRWIPESTSTAHGRPSLTRFVTSAASTITHGRRSSLGLQETPSPQCDGEARTISSNGVKVSRLPPVQENNVAANGVDGFHEDDKQLHVLVVEDNLVNQRVLAQQLRRAGCTVHVADHGLECLNFLERSSFCGASTPLSVILLDLEMPVMDGLTCIRHIRHQQSSGKINSHVPVIAVTANARSEQIKNAIDAGMDLHITKPFRIAELIPQMEDLVAEVTLRGAPSP